MTWQIHETPHSGTLYSRKIGRFTLWVEPKDNTVSADDEGWWWYVNFAGHQVDQGPDGIDLFCMLGEAWSAAETCVRKMIADAVKEL